MTIRDVLQKIGLSKTEAKVYEALLDLKEANVQDVAAATSVHKRNIYDALHRLVDKGLVFPIITEDARTYSPVDPDKLFELVKEKQTQFLHALPLLLDRYVSHKGRQELYVYKGIEGIKKYIREILRVGEDVYTLGGKLAWFDPQIAAFTKHFFEQAQKKNISFHTLFDNEVKDEIKKRDKEFLQNLYSYKFFPAGYSTSSAIDIFGEYIVTFSGVRLMRFDESTTIFIINDKNLAVSFKQWFRYMFSLL